MKKFLKRLSDWFNGTADDGLPKTDFCKYLKEMFGREATVKVLEALQKLNLPVPENEKEFMMGTEGALMFLDKYGVVIRIEDVTPRRGRSKNFERINDSPWVLQPIGVIKTGRVTIEICPGCHVSTTFEDTRYLDQQLDRENIAYWDDQVTNSGRMPLKMPSFPEGIPVVIDRLAVCRLTNDLVFIRKALKTILREKPLPVAAAAAATKEAVEAQEKLYGALRGSFDEAWADPAKMGQFWAKCEEAVRDGQLVVGWQKLAGPLEDKANKARVTGAWYSAKLK